MTVFAMTLSLFFVLNSLGNVPLFVGLLGRFTVKKQRRIICRELVIALGILLLFNFFGDNLLKMLGISQPCLGVAGGTLLFIIALGMIFPRTSDSVEVKETEPMIVPLATPIVAGPGSDCHSDDLLGTTGQRLAQLLRDFDGLDPHLLHFAPLCKHQTVPWPKRVARLSKAGRDAHLSDRSPNDLHRRQASLARCPSGSLRQREHSSQLTQ